MRKTLTAAGICLLRMLHWPAALGAQMPGLPVDAYGMFMGAQKPAAAAGAWEARVKRISGDVRLRRRGGDWEKMDGETELGAADSVRTADGTAELYLDDGAVMYLERSTEISADSLSRKDPTFTLLYGGISAKFRESSGGALNVQLRTPAGICIASGGEFAAEYSRLVKNAGFAVYDEGRAAVKVQDVKGAVLGEYELEKNMELSFVSGQKRFRSAPLFRMRRYKARIAAMRPVLASLRGAKKRREASAGAAAGPAGKAPAAVRARRSKRSEGRKTTEKEGPSPAPEKKTGASPASAEKKPRSPAVGRLGRAVPPI
ncbi:MAG TPA: FecR domain-containing protein [Elusimicrobiales bacterium]|nr:FecR domain-containing protein [Elusimicrobiales bacterium]